MVFVVPIVCWHHFRLLCSLFFLGIGCRLTVSKQRSWLGNSRRRTLYHPFARIDLVASSLLGRWLEGGNLNIGHTQLLMIRKKMSWSLSSIVNGLTKWTFKPMMLLKGNLVEEISWWRCQWYFSFKCGNNYDIFYASGSFGCEYGTTMIYYVLLIPIKLGFWSHGRAATTAGMAGEGLSL